MQTLSKSFGLAQIRCRLTSYFPLTCSSYSFNTDLVAIAQPLLNQILTDTKLPYNTHTPTAHLALHALSTVSLSSIHKQIEMLKASWVKFLSSLHGLKELGLDMLQVYKTQTLLYLHMEALC